MGTTPLTGAGSIICIFHSSYFGAFLTAMIHFALNIAYKNFYYFSYNFNCCSCWIWFCITPVCFSTFLLIYYRPYSVWKFCCSYWIWFCITPVCFSTFLLIYYRPYSVWKFPSLYSSWINYWTTLYVWITYYKSGVWLTPN